MANLGWAHGLMLICLPFIILAIGSAAGKEEQDYLAARKRRIQMLGEGQRWGKR